MKKTIMILTALALSTSVFAAQDMVKKSKGGAMEVSSTPKSDAEITNSLMTVNTQEMSLAKVAKEKTQNEQVKNYANRMFTDHAKNDDNAQAFASKQNINLKETKSSMDVKILNEDKVEQLKTMEGKAFDKSFMEAQVDIHKKALDKLDSTLIPNATNEELRTMLQNTRSAVQTHLKEAQQIQSSLQ